MAEQPCPGCGTPVKAGKCFCSKCGARTGDVSSPEGGSSVSTRQGKSSLHLDADAVNMLLEQFASQPGGASFSLQEGRLQVEHGEVKMTLENLRLQDALVRVRHLRLGGVRLDLRKLQLDSGGLGASLDISVD